jgi:hypothetical protein
MQTQTIPSSQPSNSTQQQSTLSQRREHVISTEAFDSLDSLIVHRAVEKPVLSEAEEAPV